MSDILSIGLSGLTAAQLGLTTTSNNVANASTPGYTVENPIYEESSGQYSGAGFIGSGVTTTTIQRSYSQYLTTELNNAQATNSSLSTNYSFTAQLNNLIGSPTAGISTAITTYFTGLQNVANDPSDLATRQTAISDAQSLASQINATGEQYDQLNQSVNQQLTSTVSEVNTYATQIAQLNVEIATASASGQQPNQLLDQRDELVSEVSQQVGVSVVQNSSGYSLFLSDGQPLVSGSQAYQLGTATSSSNPSELALTYNGAAGSSAPATAVELPDSAVSGGTIGGLLAFRSQTLEPAQSQLGAIATSFASQVNAQNALGIDLNGNPGGNLFNVTPTAVYANQQNTGNATVTASLVNPEQPPTDNYSLSFDGTNYTLTDTTTGQQVATQPAPLGGPTTMGPLTINITSGAMNAGDSFAIQPTAGALDSFSVATTNPTAIAAASPVLASASTTNAGTATISEGTVTAGYNVPTTPTTLTYNSTTGMLTGWPAGSTVSINGGPPTSTTGGVAYTSGDTYTVYSTPSTSGLNDVSFTMNGTPSNGDTFTIAQNTATDDGRNAIAMAQIVSQNTMSNGSTTLTGAYANYVNNVGNAASQLNAVGTTQSALVSQISSAQQSVSGVNLDDEATNLMQYQELYQANSKVIQTADTIFQTLIGIFQ
jgi:flagellar hook-associated protein 1 FlgK